MGGDWVVVGLVLGDRGVTVAVVGTARRAAFELTCAARTDQSPFDLD